MLILLVIPLFVCLLIFLFVSLLKRKCILSLLLSLLLVITNLYAEIIAFSFSNQEEVESSDITVLSYNVHTFRKDYKEKEVAIAHEILGASADVVYLTEFELKMNKRLDSIMTMHNSYTRYYLSGTNCVFYSKYALDSIVGIHAKGSKRKKSLTNKVHVFVGKDTLTIVGCHLSSSNHHIRKGYQNRAKEADAIYESIKGEHHPLIVMGDLNDISGSYAVERIKDAGLQDAWWKGGCGYGATFCEGWLRLRLDHILYQKDILDLNNVKIIDSNLSDHYALVADFHLSKS